MQYGPSVLAFAVYILEIAISVYVLVAIIKKRLKIDVRSYTILQILSLITFEQIQLNKPINYSSYQSQRA